MDDVRELKMKEFASSSSLNQISTEELTNFTLSETEHEPDRIDLNQLNKTYVQ